MSIPTSDATAHFVGLDGQGQRTTLIISVIGTQLVNGQVLSEAEPVVVTTATGDLTVKLPRGARVRIAVEGTTLVREITVPDVATFDLMQAMTDAPDPYSVQTVEPLVERRSF